MRLCLFLPVSVSRSEQPSGNAGFASSLCGRTSQGRVSTIRGSQVPVFANMCAPMLLTPPRHLPQSPSPGPPVLAGEKRFQTFSVELPCSPKPTDEPPNGKMGKRAAAILKQSQDWVRQGRRASCKTCGPAQGRASVGWALRGGSSEGAVSRHLAAPSSWGNRPVGWETQCENHGETVGF